MVTAKQSKQRVRQRDAPLNLRGSMISAHLSKDLRKKYSKRSISLRVGDSVEVMRGSNKGKKGKVILVDRDNMKVNVEGITIKRKDGHDIAVNFDASNLLATELYTDDKKRFKHTKKGKGA